RSPADGDRLLWRAYDLNTEAEWNNAIAQRIHLPSTDHYFNTWSSNGVVPARRIGSRVDFFEGNNGEQDHLCQLDPALNTTLQLAGGGCPNDEIRSLVLTNPPVGRAIRLFDDPNGSREDDWVEIAITAPVPSFTLRTFQESIAGSPVRVSYFRNNGLDG